MKLHSIAFEDITIEKDRQRKYLPIPGILELAGSIAQTGLIHPVVVRTNEDGQFILVAGERRIRAMEYVWNFGQSVKCGDYTFEPQMIPCILYSEMDATTAYAMELEENARRLDITWQEKAIAIARLAKLQGEISGEEPSPAEIAEELGMSPSVEGGGGSAAMAVRQNIILAKYLEDPDIAKAPSRVEAFKLLKRKEETAKNIELGRKVEKTLAGEHRLIKGNCHKEMEALPPAFFDVILSDPPYGMNAQDFGDSQGVGGAVGGHFYDDSPEHFQKTLQSFAVHSAVLAKPQAHLYVFCDIDWFVWLKELFTKVEWKVFRTPLIWFNPGGSRAPWPQHGPQRKTQYILYAQRGGRPVTSLLGDVIQCNSDPNLNHPAQKPVALYSDLLRRSVRPGDSVLDPFAGTGTIFPAAHGLKCRATGIEQDEAACGIAMKRLEQLK